MGRLLWLASAAALAGLAAPAAADPADRYTITPDVGPWAICVASYVGEEAPNLAHQLAEQLRTRDHLAAYVFDRGDEERKRDWEEHLKKEATLGDGIKLPFKHPRYTQSCAVLIGGFTDMDAATAALQKVRELPEPKLVLSNGQPAYDVMWAPPDPGKAGENKPYRVNPFTRSFVTRNPAAPKSQGEAPKVDPAWKELNASESYSLLKNPKPWTLAVKQYTGATVLQNRQESTDFWDKLRRLGRNPGEGITAAGFQAHHLAEFLRDKRIGFDAYVLHTRTNSIVTVGGFDGPDDPELQRTKERLERLSFRADGRSQAAATIKGDPIGLFAHPLPMEVPHF
jgi:hypothetical protein